MTYALKYSKAAPALAMSYLSVVGGLLGGFFFFHEVSHCRAHDFAVRACLPACMQVCCGHLYRSLSGLLHLKHS